MMGIFNHMSCIIYVNINSISQKTYISSVALQLDVLSVPAHWLFIFKLFFSAFFSIMILFLAVVTDNVKILTLIAWSTFRVTDH